MILVRKSIYDPALRMKTGELQGIANLAVDIKDAILPRMIVPPRIERDAELQGVLVNTESVPGAGIILSKYWSKRNVLLDMQFLFEDFGVEKSGIWLPKAYELARRERVFAIPVAKLSDLEGPRFQAFKDAIDVAMRLKFALRIGLEDLSDQKLSERLQRIFDRLKIAQSDSIALVEFGDADFSQSDIVAGVIEGAFETLEEVGQWNSIVFQGSSYPEKNPADHGTDEVVMRNEWSAWSQGVHFNKNTADHIVFGDYAADCAKMKFGKSAAPAIRHYRYATADHWIVARGAEEGGDKAVMREVCKRIVDSKHFSGREFSSADDYIYRTSVNTDGPGNATTWRGINTTHHITRVVNDIGKIKGMAFADRKVDESGKQLQMFDLNQ
jgi:hypothetical protein